MVLGYTLHLLNSLACLLKIVTFQPKQVSGIETIPRRQASDAVCDLIPTHILKKHMYVVSKVIDDLVSLSCTLILPIEFHSQTPQKLTPIP